MSGTRGGRGRIVAMGVGLALALLLVAASEARAGKYAVAQCGWHLGSDAAWADTTGGAKFRPDSYCATPAGADPFDAAHLKSFTRDGQQTVSGNRFARWRWTTPPGTGIVQVRGTWWHALHDGFEHRLGTDGGDGGFAPFAWAGVDRSQPARLRRRLLASPVGVRRPAALRPGREQVLQPRTGVLVGAAGADDHGRGRRRADRVDRRRHHLDADGCAAPRACRPGARTSAVGVRFGETNIDGARVAITEYPCAKMMIGGEWRATTMRPCDTAVAAPQTIATNGLSDGPHQLVHCLTDFAGNVGCLPQRTIRVDNNAPAHPRSAGLAGGDGWRRVNDFDVTWSNPDQGVASPICGRLLAGDERRRLRQRRPVRRRARRRVHSRTARSRPPVPTSSTSGCATKRATTRRRPRSRCRCRFDDVPPGVAFAATDTGGAFPDTVSADLYDEHSGPAGGELRYRRLGADSWTDLQARFVRGEAAGKGQLTARLPESLAPGTYLFRAEAVDAAGNAAASTRRADGTEMTLRKPPPPPSADQNGRDRGVRSPSARGKTRIFARLRWRGRRGTAVTVPYGAASVLSGRLVDADGAGLAGRRLKVVARPSRGAVAPTRVEAPRTGEHGGFRLDLGAGPSRRISIAFAGEERLERGTAGAAQPARAQRGRLPRRSRLARDR